MACFVDRTGDLTLLDYLEQLELAEEITAALVFDPYDAALRMRLVRDTENVNPNPRYL